MSNRDMFWLSSGVIVGAMFKPLIMVAGIVLAISVLLFFYSRTKRKGTVR